MVNSFPKGDSRLTTTLLEVKGLETRFFTQDGVVKAVNGISYTLNEGETLAILITVLGFNLLGDGLRDALDPRMDKNQ